MTTSSTLLNQGDIVADGRYSLIGRYEADRETGMEFWRARDLRVNRDVALTILTGDRKDPAAVDRARRVADMARRTEGVAHPALARLLDVLGPDDGEAVARAGVLGLIVAEWTEGASVPEVLRNGPVSANNCRRMLRPLVSAVDRAHHAGLVVGADPRHIRVSPRGVLTLAFPGAAPDAEARDDVRGLGALLYLLLTGSLPGQPLVPPSSLRPELPRDLSLVTVLILDDTAVGSIRTAGVLLRVLDQTKHEDESTNPLPAIPSGGSGPPKQRTGPARERTLRGRKRAERTGQHPVQAPPVQPPPVQPPPESDAERTVVQPAVALRPVAQQSPARPTVRQAPPAPRPPARDAAGPPTERIAPVPPPTRRVPGPAARTPAAAPEPVRPQRLSYATDQRERRRKRWMLAAALTVVTIAIAAWVISQIAGFFNSESSQSAGQPTSTATAQSAPASQAPASTTPSAAPSTPVAPAGVTEYVVSGAPDSPGRLGRVIDGDTGTFWHTDTYFQQFPKFQPGLGIMASFSQPVKLTAVHINSPSAGTVVEVRSANSASPALGDTQVLGTATLGNGDTTIPLTSAPPTSQLLIWITALAPASGGYQSTINEVTFWS